MSAESSPAASAAPVQKPPKPKSKEPRDVGGFPPAFKTTEPPAGRPSAIDAAVREADARGLNTTETEV